MDKMQNWKLPSQLVTTDRQKDEGLAEFFLRHETLRRITAESDLIQALDLLDGLPLSPEYADIRAFLNKFLDKTINN